MFEKTGFKTGGRNCSLQTLHPHICTFNGEGRKQSKRLSWWVYDCKWWKLMFTLKTDVYVARKLNCTYKSKWQVFVQYMQAAHRRSIFSIQCLLMFFQAWTHSKSFEMNKKDWKQLKKSNLISFWVHAAPKSGSKYTPIIEGDQKDVVH